MNESSPPPSPETVPAKTSGMAITSLVLGILGFFTCGFTALIGLILGIISLVKIKGSKGALKGDGLSLAGIIVSAVSFIMIPLFAAMMLPALASAKQKALEINCVNNEKQLALAIMIYANDHTNRFPNAATWCEDIKNETAGNNRIFQCQAALRPATDANRCDYAFNSSLDNLDMDKVSRPERTVLVFEADGGWNASGGAALLPSPPRHNHGKVYVVAFCDGHVEAVSQSRLNSLQWEP